MKKSLIALLVLIIGACSVAPDPHPVVPTGNAILDAGLKDVLTHLNPTADMTLWRYLWQGSTSQVDDFYEGNGKFKRAYVLKHNDVLNFSWVGEGTFTKIPAFGILYDEDNLDTKITETELKGYAHLYIYTYTMGKEKIGTGAWEDLDQTGFQYFLVKEENNKRYMIVDVDKINDKYVINKSDISDANAAEFDKK